MVARLLAEAIGKELKHITNSMSFKSPGGGCRPLSVFLQALPVTSLENGDDGGEPFPYCIIRVQEGEQGGAMSPQYVRVVMLIGLWDDNEKQEGWQGILNIIQRFQERFYKNPVLENTYVMADEEGNQPIKWALQEDYDETYPYFFGGLETVWQTPSIRREDEMA